MPEYKQNSSKPDKILTGYGTVRGAELKAIYGDIGELTPRSEIEHWYGRPENGGYEVDHIDDCLRFLKTLDMVEQTGQDVLNPINVPLFADLELPFELRLLYHIRQQAGEQYHLANIHDVAIRDLSSDGGRYGRRRVGVETLVTEVRRQTDYDLTWREEKIRMWANLLGPIGAVTYSSEHDEILLSPVRGILHELLSLHQSHRSNGESLLAAFEWIDEGFMPVFSRTGDTTVHVGIADVLDNMVNDGVLTLHGMSDRTEIVDLPTTVDDTRTPADYQIATVPDRPAYWFPLDLQETRLSA